MSDLLRVSGLVNFRDLGGTPVDGGAIRPGVLFRSDSLVYATEEDAAYLRDEVRLATIVDLRDAPEVEAFGRGPLGRSPIAYLPVPVGDLPTVDGRQAYYAELLDAYGRQLADLVRRLSAPGALPALVHCHIGCDRTGVVSAMLLTLAGAAEAEVCADYARSHRASDAIRKRAESRRRTLGLPLMDKAYYDAWEPRAEIMAETLALVAGRWGSMAGWAAAFGLTATDIAALRTALVGPAD